MKILSSYSELADAEKTPGEYYVKGIDWTTRFVRPYRCHVVKAAPCVARRVSTLTYSSIVLPHHKFLVKVVDYPFSSIELKSLRRVKLENLQNTSYPIAVAPIAEVSNNPYYPGAGVISDHVITFSPITNITFLTTDVVYDIIMDEGDSYILNNTVRVI